MCLPPAIAAVATVASVGISLIAAKQQLSAQKRIAARQQREERANAILGMQDAVNLASDQRTATQKKLDAILARHTVLASAAALGESASERQAISLTASPNADLGAIRRNEERSIRELQRGFQARSLIIASNLAIAKANTAQQQAGTIVNGIIQTSDFLDQQAQMNSQVNRQKSIIEATGAIQTQRSTFQRER
jgi:hypothetical protein